MPVQVHVTSVIRNAVGGNREVSADGESVRAVLENIEVQYPGFRATVMDEAGELHRFVNIYLNDEDIRYLGGAETALKDGDQVSILPALAGG
ncbi:MAG: MoaD/ThiS family protein [Chloroflexi bacterium]|nr:MAG: MoaD/ThiS family protein [Chloroflexota bacterium]